MRYVGITTSEGRRHDLLEQIMRNEPIDFVQFSYNVVDREAEARLLPLAAERGIAVIVNRPFRQGALTRPARARDRCPNGRPNSARRAGLNSCLKFILAHPAVTVAIPATTRVDHVRENLSAAAGPMPDAAVRERMARPYAGALMSEWWTYRPEDFPAVFAARLLADVRVAQCRALAAASAHARRRPRHHRCSSRGNRAPQARWLALILAILWVFVGWSFLWNRYATINWAVAYVAPAFALEALLLLVIGSLLNGLAFDRRGPAGWTGYLILAFALAG